MTYPIINFFLINLISLFFILRMFLILEYVFCSTHLILDLELLTISSIRFNLILLLDYFRLLFLWTVLIISSRVFIFRSSYIKTDKFHSRFHFLLFSFVISMVILILSPNLIRILLGWDGLGVSSYLLVIYYSSTKAYNSGIVTFSRNRVGDSLIIIRISYFMYLTDLNISSMFYNGSLTFYWSIAIITIAAFTKRAQIPFRAWLPAAMAAPTPVSALVHSSTLVTAGVYVLFRFDSLLAYLAINKIILIFGVLTILIASMRAFFEIDIKKIVALSTLSQLGVIITAMGAGFRLLGFFHLLSHAFFKALLFIRAGNLIHRAEGYQDLRVIGGISEVLPLTKSVVIGCSIRLCGLPFISAFYSKEIIIERLLTYNLSFLSYFIIMIGILITRVYSIRLIVVSMGGLNRQRPLFEKSDIDPSTNLRIMLLFLPAVTGGWLISLHIKFKFIFLVGRGLKLCALLLVLLSFIFFLRLYKRKLSIYSPGLWVLWTLGRLWGLPFIRSRLPLTTILNRGDFLHKLVDFSWGYFIFSTLFRYPSAIRSNNLFLFQNIVFIRGFSRILIFILIIFLYIN